MGHCGLSRTFLGEGDQQPKIFLQDAVLQGCGESHVQSAFSHRCGTQRSSCATVKSRNRADGSGGAASPLKVEPETHLWKP